MEAISLQQAKDHVAQVNGFDNWNDILFDFSDEAGVIPTYLFKQYEEDMANLFAQSQKAKAWDEAIKGAKNILDIPLEEQEKLSSMVNPYNS